MSFYLRKFNKSLSLCSLLSALFSALCSLLSAICSLLRSKLCYFFAIPNLPIYRRLSGHGGTCAQHQNVLGCFPALVMRKGKDWNSLTTGGSRSVTRSGRERIKIRCATPFHFRTKFCSIRNNCQTRNRLKQQFCHQTKKEVRVRALAQDPFTDR
jgi:hypothetical protein